jgi:hypothetical protein
MLKTIRLLAEILLFAVFVGISNLPAAASDCDHPPPVEEAFATTPAVFVGRVVGSPEKTVIEDKNENQVSVILAEMLVEESFRGPAVGERVTILMPNDRSNRNWVFGDDTRSLIFGSAHEDIGLKDEKSGRWMIYVNPCGRSRPLGFTRPGWTVKPEEDLAYLRKAVQEPAGVTFSGRVIDWTRRYPEVDGPVGMPEVTIRMQGEGGQSYEVVSGKDGSYAIKGMKPGKYSCKVRSSEGRSHDHTEQDQTFTIFERGKLIRDPVVFSKRWVKGSVVDAIGVPVSVGMKFKGGGSTPVYLIACDESGRPLNVRRDKKIAKENTSESVDDEGFIRRSSSLDDNGRFAFAGVPAGTYLLVIGSDPDRVGTIPVTKTYYPGVADLANAKPIQVGPDESVEDLVLTLPEKLVRREIVGIIFGPDGMPVPKAFVCLQRQKKRGWEFVLSARTDENGHFRLIGFQGQSYRIEVFHEMRGTPFKVTSSMFTCDGEGMPLILKFAEKKEDPSDTDLTKDGQPRPEGKT